MKNLKPRSKELRARVGLGIPNTPYLWTLAKKSALNFQTGNRLAIGMQLRWNSWTFLIEKTHRAINHRNKFLEINSLYSSSKKYGVGLPAIKSVNEVESSRKDFFVADSLRVYFEDHLFHPHLKDEEIDPTSPVKTKIADMLDRFWIREYHLKHLYFYIRLEISATLTSDSKVKKAVLAAISWDNDTLMGSHALKFSYSFAQAFMDEIHFYKRHHLDTLGRYLSKFACFIHRIGNGQNSQDTQMVLAAKQINTPQNGRWQ